MYTKNNIVVYNESKGGHMDLRTWIFINSYPKGKFAEKCGVHRQTVQRYLQRKSSPDLMGALIMQEITRHEIPLENFLSKEDFEALQEIKEQIKNSP